MALSDKDLSKMLELRDHDKLVAFLGMGVTASGGTVIGGTPKLGNVLAMWFEPTMPMHIKISALEGIIRDLNLAVDKMKAENYRVLI